MPAGGGTSHLIEILLKLVGSEEAKRKMKETGDAGVAMNQKISNSAKDAAKLYTALAASTARIGSLIPTSLPFGQLAKDMTRLTSASLGTASAMKGLNVNLGLVAGVAAGALAGIFALKAAFDGLRASIRAAGETQEAIIKLGNAFKTLGVYSTDAVRRGTAFANQMQALTKYTDEEVLTTQALLAQLGRLTGEGLERATRATLDLASGLGRELPVAALIMAKAAQGSTWELRKYGLVLDENLPKTERWAAALQFVEQQFGGRAQEEIRGFNATVRQFGGAFRDVLTIIGAPLIIPATKAIQGLTQAMLKFAAVRDAWQNENLLPDDTSVQVAAEALKNANQELDKLIEKAQVNEGLLDKIFWGAASKIGAKKRIVTDDELAEAIKNREKRLNEYRNALSAYVRQIPLDKAIEMEKEFEKQMLASAAALGEARKDTDARTKDVEELEKAWRDAIKTHADFTSALSKRYEFSYDAARESLRALIGEENKALQPREQRISLVGDFELEDIARRVDEFFQNPKTQEAIKRAGEQHLPDLDLVYKAKLETGDPAEVENFINKIKRRVRESGQTFFMKFDSDPANAVALKNDIDFLRRVLEPEALITWRAILDDESIESINRGIKRFDQAFRFKGQQIELFDFEETVGQMQTLDQALQQIRVRFDKINQLEPKDQVRAWDDLMRLLADLYPKATERAKIAIKSLADEMRAQHKGTALEAAAEVQAIREGTKAREEARSLGRRFEFALKARDWEEAIQLAQEFSEVVSKIEVGTVRLEFEAKLDDMYRRLDEARQKALDLQNEISQGKSLFRLYIQLEQWDAAQEQIEALRALLDKLPEEERILLELFIEKSELEKLESEIKTKERTIQAALSVGRTDIALEKLEELKKLGEELSGERRIQFELAVTDLDMSIAEAQLTTFQQTLVSSFNSTLDQLFNLPWEAFGATVQTVWDAMLDDAVSVTDAIRDLFSRMVSDLINIMSQLAIQSLLGYSLGGPGSLVSSLTGGFLGKAQVPDVTGIRTPTFKAQWPAFDFARAPITVPVELRVPDELKKPWGVVAGAGRREVEININAIDTGSIRRQLETGDLGRELSRLMR